MCSKQNYTVLVQRKNMHIDQLNLILKLQNLLSQNSVIKKLRVSVNISIFVNVKKIDCTGNIFNSRLLDSLIML